MTSIFEFKFLTICGLALLDSVLNHMIYDGLAAKYIYTITQYIVQRKNDLINMQNVYV